MHATTNVPKKIARFKRLNPIQPRVYHLVDNTLLTFRLSFSCRLVR